MFIPARCARTCNDVAVRLWMCICTCSCIQVCTCTCATILAHVHLVACYIRTGRAMNALCCSLPQDPTYFATRVNPEEFSTHVRQDLATVKVNPTLIPENVTRQTETAKDATAKASSSPESARHPSAGVYVRESISASGTLPVPVCACIPGERTYFRRAMGFGNPIGVG